MELTQEFKDKIDAGSKQEDILMLNGCFNAATPAYKLGAYEIVTAYAHSVEQMLKDDMAIINSEIENPKVNEGIKKIATSKLYTYQSILKRLTTLTPRQ